MSDAKRNGNVRACALHSPRIRVRFVSKPRYLGHSPRICVLPFLFFHHPRSDRWGKSRASSDQMIRSKASSPRSDGGNNASAPPLNCGLPRKKPGERGPDSESGLRSASVFSGGNAVPSGRNELWKEGGSPPL